MKGASYREYVSMMAAISVHGAVGMYKRCGISAAEWTIIAAYWSHVAGQGDFADFGKDLAEEKRRLQGGSPPMRWGEDAKAARPDPTQLPGGTLAVGVVPGSSVTVLWSDRRKYLAQVLGVREGRVHVQFPNGEEHWVAQSVIEPLGSG